MIQTIEYNAAHGTFTPDNGTPITIIDCQVVVDFHWERLLLYEENDPKDPSWHHIAGVGWEKYINTMNEAYGHFYSPNVIVTPEMSGRLEFSIRNETYNGRVLIKQLHNRVPEYKMLSTNAWKGWPVEFYVDGELSVKVIEGKPDGEN